MRRILNMPLFAILYVLLVCLGALDMLRTQVTEKRRLWYTSLNLASVIVMLFMFTGYWVKGLVESIGLFAPVLLIFSIVWEICTARESACGLEQSAQNMPTEVKMIAKRFAMAFEVIVCGIGYWFGSIAVLRAYGRA